MRRGLGVDRLLGADDPGGCSGRGVCSNLTCVCEDGWTGPACAGAVPQRLRRSWVVPQWRMPLRARAVRMRAPPPAPPRPAPRRARPAPRRPAPPRAACARECSCRSRPSSRRMPRYGDDCGRLLCPNACSNGRCASDGTCECAGWMRFDCSGAAVPRTARAATRRLLAAPPTGRLSALAACVSTARACACRAGRGLTVASQPARRTKGLFAVATACATSCAGRAIARRGGLGPIALNARARTGRAVTAASASTSAATAPLASRVRIAALNYASTAALEMVPAGWDGVFVILAGEVGCSPPVRPPRPSTLPAPPPGPQPPACPPCAGDDCSELSCMRAADGGCATAVRVRDRPDASGKPGTDVACSAMRGGLATAASRLPAPMAAGRGACVDGRCLCEDGWSGKNCATRMPPWARRGACNNGTCACLPPYFGADCGAACPAECSFHGACLPTGKCECFDGWQGEACAERCEGDGCPAQISGAAQKGGMWALAKTSTQQQQLKKGTRHTASARRSAATLQAELHGLQTDQRGEARLAAGGIALPLLEAVRRRSAGDAQDRRCGRGWQNL